VTLREVVALLAIAALPLLAARLRGPVERCAMDGVEVRPPFRVRVTEEGGSARTFCGVTCAEAWLLRRGVAAREILVTAGGHEIDAGTAWFVRTAANRSDGAPDGIRVFAGREDAIRHAEAYGGMVLRGAERPFGGEGDGRADR
jgi:hypothetical protein